LKIQNDRIVRIHYTLRDDAGETIDASEPDDPLEYLHGHGNIVPGLEAALNGAEPGRKLKVDVPPEAGYGPRDEEAVITIDLDRFPKDFKPEVGMQLASRTPDGHVVRLRLTAVGPGNVTADLNHPLAGRTLHFDIEVADVREATPEELAHGHSHASCCDDARDREGCDSQGGCGGCHGHD